jgi:hypothetical protein
MARARRLYRRPHPPSLVRVHSDERGQSLVVVLALITFIFLLGSALALHASGALRTTAANEAQAGDLHAADAGAELGIWWQRQGNAGNPPDITLNGLTVSTTVSVAGGGGCTTPTPVRLTGFEHGVASTAGAGLFTAINGAGVTIDSALARSGGYSLRIADVAGSAHNAQVSVGGAVAVARFYLRLAALPAANVIELAVLDAASGSDLVLGYDSASQALSLALGGGPSVSTAQIMAGTWQRLDIRYAADTRIADWRVDGVTQTGLSTSGGASTVSRIVFGSRVAADAYTANYDDLLVSGTSADFPIGGGSVVALRPGGMGSSNNPGSFRHEDASPIDAGTYLRLDDDPLSGTAQYIRQQAGTAADYIELTFQDTAESCLSGISGIIAYHSATTTANNGKTSVFVGATERIVYSGDMSEATIFYKSAIVAPTAAPWTMAAVNSLVGRSGYSGDYSPNPYWDGLLLEMASGGTTSGTVTVTATAGDSTVTTTYTDGGAGVPTLLTWSTTR